MEMSQYLDMFIEEAKEHLQEINQNLLLLENDPNETGVINEVFRSAHTLKGMSATMGFEDMATLTHEMENVLDLIRNQKLLINDHMMNLLFQCVDSLEGMVVSLSSGGDGKMDVTQLVHQLKSILSDEPVSPVKKASSLPNIENSFQPIDLSFDQFEITVMNQSMQSGHKIYYINVELREDCILKAARAYMVFDSIENSGEIIKSFPSVEDIENEKFDRSFKLVVITKKEKAELEQMINQISEITKAEVISIDPNQYQKDAEIQETINIGDTDARKSDKSSNHNEKKVIGTKTIRVDIERLDELMNLFSELVIDRGRLEQLSREIGHAELLETVEHMSRISSDLQNLILTMRMVSVEQVFNRFPRMVRDLAKELNKKINLEIFGAETELDRTVIDEIGDPLVHILRNAIDHGIEHPEERKVKGKREEGNIQLKAYHSGNHVFIEIKDDGNGIDKNKVLQKGLEKGLITEKNAHLLDDKQVYDLLFMPGFSTAEKVSDVSGRGVGLDVVKNKIESLGGFVSIKSEKGVGSTFLIQLPLTLSIISAMLVQVEDEKYAIPLSSIIETAIFKKEEIMYAHKQQVIDFRGRVVPLVSLQNVFDIPKSNTNQEDEIPVLIVRKGEKMAGLVVGSFIGQQEIVLKSLGKYLTNIFAISGATILGDGQVALIIDCNALIK
ncbi:chemotaxis protein CheA [Microaerobacter geothermalis]|uniref:chemotaxis protein CheA n=1 Tax=Microaerobacter geothermalis TaxID=674972 RepID=UPI001F402B12|nr:chemotaxis protein CheA [Microaerobacter geothermalis]MCF6093816.1 chemotaxis protein CheA [Microaerobacter geothermalis]